MTRDLDALFTGVLLATGPRPPMFSQIPAARAKWRRQIRDMLGETVGHNEAAGRDLYMVYMRWLKTKENHAALQRL